MRVRLNRLLHDDRNEAPTRTRLRVVPNQHEAVPPPREVTEEFADERRLRDAGGPDDTATYNCTCGYVFEAPVTTSVGCPHCGATQAW